MSTREPYIEKMKTQLDKLNLTLNEFDVITHHAYSQLQNKYLVKMSKLHKQSQIAADRLDEPQKGSEELWQIMATDTKKFAMFFFKSFHSFQSHLKHNHR